MRATAPLHFDEWSGTIEGAKAKELGGLNVVSSFYEGESHARPRMCMRAWPDEWELLKRFKKTIAKDKDASKAALEELEQKVFCGKESRQKKVQ